MTITANEDVDERPDRVVGQPGHRVEAPDGGGDDADPAGELASVQHADSCQHEDDPDDQVDPAVGRQVVAERCVLDTGGQVAVVAERPDRIEEAHHPFEDEDDACEGDPARTGVVHRVVHRVLRFPNRMPVRHGGRMRPFCSGNCRDWRTCRRVGRRVRQYGPPRWGVR